MSQSFNSHTVVVGVLLSMSFVAACPGPAIELTLVLQRAADLPASATADLQSVRVVIHIEDEVKPEVFNFAFQRDSTSRLASNVTPGERFNLDASGCDTAGTTFDEENNPQCTGAIIRGCTDTLEIAAEEERPSFPVQLHAVGTPEANACPRPL
jgi:hypothetical protein